ncbi:MAG: 1,4-dihydroxy-6-naphthoate synthase [Bacteroidia bacterium]|nr:1,4-dihydroxy-6-naphthoate synthase [Bacteroidia bacterium]MCX7652489.1 1,4-dihydroxy-6-naphthoate synthase [Bacteroidia bacterium]
MSRTLTVAISPCPNDTFIWGALALGKVKLPFRLQFQFEDIQTLNQLATTGGADIVKISFFQYALLPPKKYRLLPVGVAMGYGVGPLLIARYPISYDSLWRARIGIPGRGTTAYSLLRFFIPHAENLVEMRYERLMPALALDEIDAAVIIHESRFTYHQWGFVCLQDLGTYWTEKTGYPIPLGGVVVRPTLPRRLITRALRRSLWLAQKRRVPHLDSYISFYAQEMDSEVQQAHIQLYVNSFSYRLGNLGKAAIRYYIKWVRQMHKAELLL